jgi:glycosyltransferase involved in cell wall biosynthesis
LIFHGYLLRGTGSNVYNASVAQALARLGHEVHLLCQDREAGALPWVSAVGGAGAGPGTVTVHVPEIGGMLPVYVADRYEGFEVKTFPQLSDAELERYLEANVEAVRGVVEATGGVDAALANHLVMGPAIAARAGLGARDGGPGYAVKVHGSALEFTVKPNPRFLPFAREGVEAASGILVGSRHTAESLWAALGDPGLRERTRLGPPGVDVELFAPIPRSGTPNGAAGRLRELAADLRRVAADPSAAFARDAAEAADAVEHLAGASGPRVVFVGKLIDTKGVDLLLAAWPLVVAKHPGALLLVAGFGEGRERIEALAAALDAGDLGHVRDLASRPGGSASRWRMLGAFLDSAPAGYADTARAAAGSVSFAGRLEHDEVARLVPAADALVMPSTFPEAFGMVAAEAAAAGVLPLSAAHSGMLEVSSALAEALPPQARELVSFALGDGSVAAIADRLDRWLALDPATAQATRDALSATAQRLWSWEGVANGVVAASQGRLAELPAVPG